MHWILDLIQGVYHFYTQSSIFSGSAGIGHLTGKQFHCHFIGGDSKFWTWICLLFTETLNIKNIVREAMIRLRKQNKGFREIKTLGMAK